MEKLLLRRLRHRVLEMVPAEAQLGKYRGSRGTRARHATSRRKLAAKNHANE